MSDEPKDSLSTEYILKEVHDKEKKGVQSPKVYRGKPIDVGIHSALVSSIFSEGGPQGFQVQVVFLDNKNQGMIRNAKWSEPSWKFLEGDIAQHAGPAFDDLIQQLRAKKKPKK